MMPAPGIRGRIAAVQVQGDEVIQVFGGNATAARLNTSYGKTGNYMYFRGGTLRFGKLTMANADLRLIDSNPKDPFDFSIDHYNSQLVAGYSKNTPGYGLVVTMPDYYKVSHTSQSVNRQGDVHNKPLAAASRLSKP